MLLKPIECMGPREILSFLESAFIGITMIMLILNFSIMSSVVLLGIGSYIFKDKKFAAIICVFVWLIWIIFFIPSLLMASI